MNSSNVRSTIPSIAMGYIIAWLVAVSLILWTSGASAGPGLLFPDKKPRIAIDPGHGGADSGARGPTGQMEKAIVLELSRQLALVLETHYEVILTRSDDYSIAPRQRAAIANQAEAELYIAIHTGAGFLHGTNNTMVYYYNPLRNEANGAPGASDTKDHQRWNRTQVRHKDASISLATTMTANLEKLESVTDCKIQGAPLMVLEGADMPAVLIEVGHMTHPATEKSYQSPKYIQQLAQAIAQGVKDYFELSPASHQR